jgi:transketolase
MTSNTASPAVPVHKRELPEATSVRRTILEMLYRSRASHLGSSMSLVEILIAIYGACDIDAIRAHQPGRDRVFVSKGHGAAATYATMHHFGLMSEDDLATYHQDDSLLAGHVSHAVPGVEHSTGALGHGLPVAVGAAIGLVSAGYDDALVFCVLGDGEIQEGSVWEALMLASHRRLRRLIPVVDNNHVSSITETAKVIDMAPLRNRFEGFGFAVHEVDGHDIAAIGNAIEIIRRQDKQSVVIADTVKGKGVPFAEGQPVWHYRSLDDKSFAEAMAALNGSPL